MILESKGTPNLVSDIINSNSNDIKDCIKNKYSLSLKINESTDNYKLVADVKIKFDFGDRYNANMNYKECLDSNFKNCIINIKYPKTYELPLIFKSISHELTHLYELYQIKDKFDVTRWKWQDALNSTIRQQKLGSDIIYFRDMLYLSLPQELNARVSSIYIYLSMKSMSNISKDDLIKMLEGTNEWLNYLNLLNFSSNQLTLGLINNFKENMNFLYFIFNELNKSLNIDYRIESIEDIKSYLSKVNKMFKNSANKYKNKLMRVVDRVYEEMNKKLEYLTHDPGNVDYEEYIKEDKQKMRSKKLETLLEYSDFIKEI
jgi:hypothetical protein